MCGILGYFSSKQPVSTELFKASLSKMNHRGPDNCSVLALDGGLLGHVRLSIIDLGEQSNQPMSDDEGNLIVFNGEIYNFKEIRKKLCEEYHVRFKTCSDTEVILEAYKIFGEKALDLFNGMFAFCIYLKESNQLFLARDRVGKKPLYYFYRNNIFAFSSELKAIIKFLPKTPDLSKEAIHEYLSIGYIVAPNSIYSDISQLPPSCYMTVDIDTFSAIKTMRYWHPVEGSGSSYKVSDLKSLLVDSVRLRRDADVPVGLMLSGGIDSNIILSMLDKKNTETFTIGSDVSHYNEADIARDSATYFGFNNHVSLIKPSLGLIDQLIECYDEPFSDSSALPSLLLNRFIADNSYRCVLNGDGADEVFAGYDRYKFLIFYQYFHSILKYLPSVNIASFKYKSVLSNLNRLMYLMKFDSLDEAYAEQNLINKGFEGVALDSMDDYRHTILQRLEHCSAKGLNKYLLYDYQYYLPNDLLVKMDRASMFSSVEVRSPFLDYRLAEAFFNVDFSEKMSLSSNKKHLRSNFGRDLPGKILNRRKTGFQVPIDQWFLHELKDEVMHLQDSILIDMGFVKKQYIDDVISKHFSKKQNMKFQIWSLLVLEKWLKRWAI